MGRMRKEIMGRPPHSVLPSICFRVSLNAVFVVLDDGKERGKFSSSCCLLQKLVTVHGCHSQQLLQRPLLEGLVGAVDNVGLKVVRGVVLNNIANVPDHRIVIVTPLKVLKKPENGEGEVSNEVTVFFLPQTDGHSRIHTAVWEIVPAELNNTFWV